MLEMSAYALCLPCRPPEPCSSVSDKGSTLITGCVWSFVVSVPGAGFAGVNGHPVALVSLEIAWCCCSCRRFLCFPPLFPPQRLWSLPSGLTTDQPSSGPPTSLDPWVDNHPAEDLEPGTEPGVGARGQTLKGGHCGQVCVTEEALTVSRFPSVLMNCPPGEG